MCNHAQTVLEVNCTLSMFQYTWDQNINRGSPLEDLIQVGKLIESDQILDFSQRWNWGLLNTLKRLSWSGPISSTIEKNIPRTVICSPFLLVPSPHCGVSLPHGWDFSFFLSVFDISGQPTPPIPSTPRALILRQRHSPANVYNGSTMSSLCLISIESTHHCTWCSPRRWDMCSFFATPSTMSSWRSCSSLTTSLSKPLIVLTSTAFSMDTDVLAKNAGVLAMNGVPAVFAILRSQSSKGQKTARVRVTR